MDWARQRLCRSLWFISSGQAENPSAETRRSRACLLRWFRVIWVTLTKRTLYQSWLTQGGAMALLIVARRIVLLFILCALVVLPLVKATGAAAQSLDGYWLSDGYGLLAEIKGGEIKLFEITSLSCIASDTLKLKAEPADSRGMRFVSGDDAIFLTPGPSPNTEWFHDPGAASKILFRRTATRPEVCTRETPNDPVTNFEIFAATFAAH